MIFPGLAKGSYYKSTASKTDFNLSSYIVSILVDQNIISQDDVDGCCFNSRSVFIKKGLIGKGTIIFKKQILRIIESLGVSVSFECCNDSLKVFKTIFDYQNIPGSLSLKDEIKRILDFYSVDYLDDCCIIPTPCASVLNWSYSVDMAQDEGEFLKIFVNGNLIVDISQLSETGSINLIEGDTVEVQTGYAGDVAIEYSLIVNEAVEGTLFNESSDDPGTLTFSFTAGCEKVYDITSELIATNLRVLSLVNEEGDSDLIYPLGVLSVTGIYIGIATNTSDYITLWNSNITNQAIGTIISGVGNQFIVDLINPLQPSFELFGLEFYTMRSSVANMVVHVSDNDIITYNAVAVRGSTGTNTLSSSLSEYNGTFGVAFNTAIQIRRITCTGATIGTDIRIFHSRVSERIGATATTPYTLFTGLLPKACKTFAVRGPNTLNFVSGITNWNELKSIEYYSIMNLGGVPFFMSNVSFYYPAPPSTIGLMISDLEGSAFVVDVGLFGWITDANLPNLERLIIKSNGNPGDIVGASTTWFPTMPKLNRQFQISNNNASPFSTAAASDSAWNSVATALSGIIPVTPATIRLEETNAKTAASLTSRNNLIAAGWTLTFT